jgi:hypothetical protein
MLGKVVELACVCLLYWLLSGDLTVLCAQNYYGSGRRTHCDESIFPRGNDDLGSGPCFLVSLGVCDRNQKCEASRLSWFSMVSNNVLGTWCFLMRYKVLYDKNRGFTRLSIRKWLIVNCNSWWWHNLPKYFFLILKWYLVNTRFLRAYAKILWIKGPDTFHR